MLRRDSILVRKADIKTTKEDPCSEGPDKGHKKDTKDTVLVGAYPVQPLWNST